MDRLWAPWRLAYVAAPRAPSAADACFICTGLEQSNDRENLIVRRADRSLLILNRFPYNNGHLLIAPRAHKANLSDLDADETLETMQTLSMAIELLRELLHPEGFNVGLNLGLAAGAGLPGHLHWHLVPRWIGDTNFMPIVGNTKVIAQSLDALYDLIAERLHAGPR